MRRRKLYKNCIERLPPIDLLLKVFFVLKTKNLYTLEKRFFTKPVLTGRTFFSFVQNLRTLLNSESVVQNHSIMNTVGTSESVR